MSLISSLNNAAAALTVFSRAIDVEGGNVANAATPGYAAIRTTIQPITSGGASGGSDYITTSSAGDYRLDSQVQAASSDASWSQTRSDVLSPLNQLFDITGNGGLLSVFQQFSAAFSDLAVTPNDPVLRSNALSAADAVAAAFRKTASGIDSQLSQVDGALGDITGEINRLTTQIRDANVSLRGKDQPDAAQESIRRSALDQLSSLVDITVSPSSDGTVTVLTGGQQPLVIGDQAYSISVSPSTAPPGQVTTSGGGNSPGVYGGKLGALLDIRNNTIAGLLGGSDGAGSLNTLAKGFASRVNSLLSSGATSSGTAGVPIFTYDSNDQNVARSLTLDPNILPDQLALATTGSSGQANGNANALGSLFNSSNTADWVGGTSLQNLYSSIATGVGQQLSTARQQATSSQTALTSATAARQQVSGVSLDESALAITSLQRYYQASAKLVSILDTLTQTEINLIR